MCTVSGGIRQVVSGGGEPKNTMPNGTATPCTLTYYKFVLFVRKSSLAFINWLDSDILCGVLSYSSPAVFLLVTYDLRPRVHTQSFLTSNEIHYSSLTKDFQRCHIPKKPLWARP